MQRVHPSYEKVLNIALPSEGRLSFFGTPAPHHRNGGSIYSGVPSTIVIIMAGPLAKKVLVQKNAVSPERSANILDAVSAGAMCLIPYGFGPLLAYMFAGSSGAAVNFSLLSTIPYMFHGWALLAVMLFSMLTGWGRDRTEFAGAAAGLAHSGKTV